MNRPTRTLRPRQLVAALAAAVLLAHLVAVPWVHSGAPRLAVVAAEVAALAMVALAARRWGALAEELLLLNAVPWQSLVAAGLVAVAAGVLLAEADAWVQEALTALGWAMPVALWRAAVELQLARGARELAAVVVCVAVVPAVVEELLFRGFVLASLCARLGGLRAVVGSAVLFAAAHLNPWEFTPLLAFGLLLGVLVWRTHSLYPAVLAHLVNNLASILVTNGHAHFGWAMAGPQPHMPGWVAAVAAVVGAIGCRWLWRQPAGMPLPMPSGPDAPSASVATPQPRP
jgi:membrane protease YdiL (CAAX protease family)